jgi:hypothetical protein
MTVRDPIPPRLHVLFARFGPGALVIRRGPSRCTHLIAWDRGRDSFEPGQWLKARVYERRCDLSPHGRYLAYFALDGHWNAATAGAYTAISRPPYFTALALWPKGDAWHGGGLFANDSAFYLHGDHSESLIRPIGKGAISVVREPPVPLNRNGECLGLYFPRLQRDGWKDGSEVASADRRDVWRWEKCLGRVCLVKYAVATMDHPPGKGVYYDEHELVNEASGVRVALPDAEWADIDRHQSRIVYASKGKLWAAELAGSELRAIQLADFTEMTFQPIASPAWARRWMTDQEPSTSRSSRARPRQ